jgi:hypothetical protein
MRPLVETQILVELVVSLARHQEEGRKLSPQIYLCENLGQMIKQLPDSDYVKVGECPVSEGAVGEILKKCAPLAIGGWCVFIENSEKRLNFGVFRGSLSALSIPIDRTLFSGEPGDLKLVRLCQTADDCIEVINHCGDKLNIFLSHRKEDTPHPKKFTDELVKVICQQVSSDLKETAETFIHKTLTDSLRESHGCLIAVCRSIKLPKLLSDSVPFSPPIDFAEEIRKSLETKQGLASSDTDTTSVLTSNALLIKGALSCDGIVAFSRDAKLLAYRCFINISSQKQMSVVGGARKRAFEALCSKIDRYIYAAFIQSQDGYTDFRRAKNGK